MPPSRRQFFIAAGRPLVLVVVSLLAACSGGSKRAENDARLAQLRASPAATYVPHNGVLVGDHTYPLCSADSRPSGQFERDFRIYGSVDRTLTEATRVFVRAGWRVRAREGDAAAGRGVWFDRPVSDWMAVAIVRARAKGSRLSIVLAAPSRTDC